MADREERSRGKQTAERYVQALDEVSTLGDLPDRSIFDGPYRRLFTAQCVSSFGDWGSARAAETCAVCVA